MMEPGSLRFPGFARFSRLYVVVVIILGTQFRNSSILISAARTYVARCKILENAVGSAIALIYNFHPRLPRCQPPCHFNLGQPLLAHGQSPWDYVTKYFWVHSGNLWHIFGSNLHDTRTREQYRCQHVF